MSVLTVTLNPAIDKLYTILGFQPGGVYRPTETRVYAGGKGINVARVFQALGGAVTATGFLGGGNGEYIRQSLGKESLPEAFVSIAQDSRVCTMILDPERHTETDLNEIGPIVSLAECESLISHLRELLPASKAVVLSGSLPPGAPAGLYADIICLAQDEFGVPAMLDASNDALQFGALAKPFLLKPNVHELTALSVEGDGWAGSASALRTRYGVPLALVTGGSRGAVLASADGIWEASPPVIDLVSTVGSGDSLTAAFVWAWEQNYSLPEALKLGVAAGAANATAYGSGFCTRSQIFELAAQTRVNKLD
jgi:1-phosphofructokinase family hexose kinase